MDIHANSNSFKADLQCMGNLALDKYTLKKRIFVTLHLVAKDEKSEKDYCDVSFIFYSRKSNCRLSVRGPSPMQM